MDTTTPDASLMDLDPDSPAAVPPPPVPSLTLLDGCTQPQEPLKEQMQPAPAIQELGPEGGGHLMLRPTPSAPAVRTDDSRALSEPALPLKRTAPSVLERPELLLTYAQVLFNASIIFVFLYLLFSLVWTIQRDVSQKVREYELGTYFILTQTIWAKLRLALLPMHRIAVAPIHRHPLFPSCASHGNGALLVIPLWWDAHASRQRPLPRS